MTVENMARAHEHYADSVPETISIPDFPINRLLANAITEFPDRMAIDFLGRTFTYREIGEEVRRAVTVLQMYGVRKGDVVSLILPNCPQHYVAYYAITTLGATVAEHNPLAPAQQIEDQLELVGAKVVIGWEQTLGKIIDDGDFKERTYLAVNLTKALPTKSQWLLKLPIKAAKEQRAKLRGHVPSGVHSWDNRVQHAEPADLTRLTSADPDDIAVLLQTGGTTGTPKAVKLTHRNIVSNALQIEAWMPDFKKGQETVGAVLPFFHAFGLMLSLTVCVNAAASIVMTPTFDADILLAGHKRHPITFFGGVPPMYKKILDRTDDGTTVDLSTIKYCVSGAMPLDPELAKRWEKATGGYIIEGYGMSEAGPVISGSPVSPARRPSTLGIPFPSTEVKIIDPEDPSREVAAGETGEICARGPQIFAGYFKNDEETAEVMLEGGWLRTGDLGRWDDGFIVMADRRKEMIINGGFNVYPSQVEETIRSMPGVVDVAVVGMKTDSFTESVVAALVLEPGAKVDLAAVREWTEDKLSHYAMPKSIAIFDDLPRSQLGKVMRRSVRERIETFELRSGIWREKLSERSNNLLESSPLLKDRTDRLKTIATEKSEELKEKTEHLKERALETSEALREKAAEKSEALKERSEVLKEKAAEKSEVLKEKAAEKSEALKEKTEHLREVASEKSDQVKIYIDAKRSPRDPDSESDPVA